MDKEQYTHRDEIVCNSLKDIFNEIKIIKDNEKGINSFFYRGQGDANWYLASKMKRDNIEHYKNSDDKEKIKIILKEIEEEKRCLTKFLNDYKDDIQVMKDIQENIKINGRALKIITLDTIIDIDKDISTIALMQHYGEKTRALDFTRNLLVALFFAVGIDDLEMDAALWVLNKNMMFNILQNQFQNSYKAFPVDEDLMFREREQYANYLEDDGNFYCKLLKKIEDPDRLKNYQLPKEVSEKMFKVDCQIQERNEVGKEVYSVFVDDLYSNSFNERLFRQHGVFILQSYKPKDIKEEYDEMIEQIKEGHFKAKGLVFDDSKIYSPFTKIIIKKECHQEIRDYLELVGITKERLGL